MNCDQCQASMINGMFCHETGCPNAKKTWIESRGEWVRFVECFYCGCEVEQGEVCDCQQPEPDWIDSHSVTCSICGELADERETVRLEEGEAHQSCVDKQQNDEETE